MKPKKFAELNAEWPHLSWEREGEVLTTSVTREWIEGSFVDRTIAELHVTFARREHNPSPGMWKAIREIVDAVHRMANGTLEPLFHVSSLDPGVGKSQTIVHAIKNLPKDKGVLICVSRIDEIGSLVEDMALSSDEFGVFISESNAAKLAKEIDLGNKDTDKARVLFTTQQMVDSRLHKARAFANLDEFYFRGKPRAVRVWDEAMLPGEELTLSVDQIGKLPELVRKIDDKLAERLLALIVAFQSSEEGSIQEIPDLDSEHDKTLRFLASKKDVIGRDDRKVAYVLRQLSGKPVRVSRDAGGKTVLSYRESLPDDFAPVLILDASARVRKTYDFWADKRKTLYRLGSAAKNYRDLTVHIWNKGGGKGAWSNNLDELLQGVVATIKAKPDEDWLVIVHQEDRYYIPDLAAAIGALLPDHAGKISYLTWGNHHATNQYVDVKNVILAGTLFFQPSTYEARLRVSAALPVTEPIDDDDLTTIELGEHAHGILQALCRGSVRKCKDENCWPMDAYIIAAKVTGIPALISDIFPGCKIERWQPIDQPLTGYVKEAVEAIDKVWKQDDANFMLSFKDHRAMLGIKSRSQYKDRVRDHVIFRDEMKKRGIVQHSPRGGRPSHFYKAPF